MRVEIYNRTDHLSIIYTIAHMESGHNKKIQDCYTGLIQRMALKVPKTSKILFLAIFEFVKYLMNVCFFSS